VHANAGAGKTNVLTHRYLKILVETSTPMDHIVAITFTRAAAAEMRERIQRLITELLNSSEQEGLSSLLRKALGELGNARIATFHSFCSSIIRQYSDELGLDVEIRDLEEAESWVLISEAIRTTMKEALSVDSALHNESLALFDNVSIQLVQELIVSLVRSKAFCLAISERTSLSEHDWIKRQHDAVLPVLKKSAESVILDAIALLAPFSAYADYKRIEDDLHTSYQLVLDAEPIDACAIASAVFSKWFTKEGQVRDKSISRATAEFVLTRPSLSSSSLNRLALTTCVWNNEDEVGLFHIVKHIAILGKQAAEHYSRAKRARNVLDFDDMIELVLTLMLVPDVASAIRNNISYIMVDEFQDTDPTQYRLLEMLAPALVDPSSTTPNIFIVGDDKQSIYGFRDADVRLFRRATQAIRRANLAHGTDDGYRPLTHSYRMHQDLCTSVNAICSSVFGSVQRPDDDDLLSYDVAYSDLVAGHIAPSSELLGTLSVVTPEDDEVDAVARVIVSILNGKIRKQIATIDASTGTWTTRDATPGDIAVLVPKNVLVGTIAEALRKYGIPFQAYGGRAFFTRPEVTDIRALLMCCSDPSNDLATATLLRSPLLRCTLSEITRASLTGRASSLRDGLHQLVTSDRATERLLAANAHLEEWSSWTLTMELPTFVRRVLYSSRWHETIAKDPRREQILANVEKVLDIIRSTVDGTGAGIHDAIEALEPPALDREREGQVQGTDDAVHIMTTHMAKGLEFGIIIMAGLSTNPPSASKIYTDQLGQTFSMPDKIAYTADPSTMVNMKPLVTHEVNKELNRQKENSELRRRLYVALTRAKMHIVVSIMSSDTPEKLKGLGGMLARVLYDPACTIAHKRITVPSETDRFEYHSEQIVEVDFTNAIHSPLPELISPSDLLHNSIAVAGDRTSDGAIGGGAVFGLAVHDVLSALIRTFHSMTDEELTSEIVRMLATHDLDRTVALNAVAEIMSVLDVPLVRSYSSVLQTSRVETRLVGAFDATVIQGVMDVRIHTSNTEIELWDWKTNAVSSTEHLLTVAAVYEMQMRTYAWLCLQSFPECTLVTTRLVFTKAAHKGLSTIDHVWTWRRDDSKNMESALRLAIGKLSASSIGG